MILVAILRIKNQIDTIDECMNQLSNLVDKIIVLDNSSTDGTLECYKKYPKIVSILHTEGFDEGRDKIMLLDEAKKRNPDWILWIDADEVFELHLTREIIEGYMNSKYNKISFRMCNFWLSSTHCRYDSQYWLYTLHPQRSMWRNIPEAYFRNRKIHNGDIQGVSGKTYISPYRIRHLGYINKNKVEEKMKLYSGIDKSNDRNYAGNLMVVSEYKTFKYFEFKNKTLNYLYIFLYKHVLNFLWFAEKIRYKLKHNGK